MKESIIRLPIASDGSPDLTYIETYIKKFSFIAARMQAVFRQDSLGEDYSDDAITERLRGTRTVRRKLQPEVLVMVSFE